MKTHNLLVLVTCLFTSLYYTTVAQLPDRGCGLTVTATPTNATAPQAHDGSVTTSVTNGTAPYTYQWYNSAETTAGRTNLGTGYYCVTVTDADNCTASACARVSAPGCAGVGVAISYTSGAPNQNSASATPVSGTSPYTYAWSTGSTDSAITNLPAGIYCITLTDAIGCSATGCAGEQVMGVNNTDITTIASLYPNPAQHAFTIELAPQQTAVLTLATIQGNVVLTQVLNKSVNTIPVATLPNGVYLVNVLSNWQWKTQRLVVQH